MKAIAVDGSNIYLGGTFGLAAFDLASGQRTSWQPPVNGTVNALAYTGGTLYAGGQFFLGAGDQTDAAAFSVTTGEPTIWNPGLHDDAFGSAAVNALAVVGSTVYLGGQFHTVDGQPRSRLAAVTATTGALVPWNPQPNAAVNALAPGPGTIYAGGDFTGAGPPIANIAAIARLHPDGSLDADWHPNPDGSVSSIVFAGTTLYLGGYFTLNGTHPGLVAASTATGALLDWSQALGDPVEGLAAADGKLFAASRSTGCPRSTSRPPHPAASACMPTWCSRWPPQARRRLSAAGSRRPAVPPASGSRRSTPVSAGSSRGTPGSPAGPSCRASSSPATRSTPMGASTRRAGSCDQALRRSTSAAAPSRPSTQRFPAASTRSRPTGRPCSSRAAHAARRGTAALPRRARPGDGARAIALESAGRRWRGLGAAGRRRQAVCGRLLHERRRQGDRAVRAARHDTAPRGRRSHARHAHLRGPAGGGHADARRHGQAEDRTKSKNLTIKFSGGYRIGRIPHAKGCRGVLTIQVFNGRKLLQSKTAKLDSRCRYKTTFSVARTKVGSAKKLSVLVRFHGNRYLGATRNRFSVHVPD